MKCLKTRSGKIMEGRYTDETAATMVASGNYEYCCKEDWKRVVRNPRIEAQRQCVEQKGGAHDDKTL